MGSDAKWKRYEQIYVDIQNDFLRSLKVRGIQFERPFEYQKEIDTLKQNLINKGLTVRNGGSSLALHTVSPACEACATGIGSITSLVSLECHRDCYYCFNSNQSDYELHSVQKNDWRSEIDSAKKKGNRLTHIALTGGEPLLHRKDALSFFTYARELFPQVHTRLYTSGDLLDRFYLADLEQAGLQEIRFSIKLEDALEMQEKVLANLRLALEYIPAVMVEMPIIPNTLDEMQALLLRLDDIGIFGINLLEFCFPLHRFEEFEKRGFLIRNPPFTVLYEYGYAGGLPVAKSELQCLQLLDFAESHKLRIGVHYCSLENKHRGQIYEMNVNYKNTNPLMRFSEENYFLETLKLFDDDILCAKQLLESVGAQYYLDEKFGFIQCHPDNMSALEALGLHPALSINIAERRNNQVILRELQIKR